MYQGAQDAAACSLRFPLCFFLSMRLLCAVTLLTQLLQQPFKH